MQNVKEKKENYNNSVTQIEHGSFTPLVFSIYDGMIRKCIYNILEQVSKINYRYMRH